jgi:uncharacterized protein YjbI with pentapeptide repeats
MTEISSEAPGPTGGPYGTKPCHAGDGCRGIRLPGEIWCFAHAGSAERQAALERFFVAELVDLRGTQLSAELVEQLLADRSVLPACLFDDAVFTTPVSFDNTRFEGKASFVAARFTGDALFNGARFNAEVDFARATFDRHASFVERTVFTTYATFDEAEVAGKATFNGEFAGTSSWRGLRCARVGYSETRFGGPMMFNDAAVSVGIEASGCTFDGGAVFAGTEFGGYCIFDDSRFDTLPWGPEPCSADFSGAKFAGPASFVDARFSHPVRMNSVVLGRRCSLDGMSCEGSLDLSSTTVAADDLGAFQASSVSLAGTTFESRIEARIGAHDVDASAARFPMGGRLTAAGGTITLRDTAFPVRVIVAGDPDHRPRLTSLDGADVEALTLSSVDCRECRFAGAQRLDALRLEGGRIFARAPTLLGSDRGRRVIAEEIELRRKRGSKRWAGLTESWATEPGEPPAPATIAGIYRDLRKGREDNKDEPGAADFYYGEMEMRRRAAWTWSAERFVLTLYWLVAGYGLRASRAIGAFLALIAVSAAMLAAWGFGTPRATVPSLRATDANGQVTRIAPETPARPARAWVTRFEDGVWLSLESAVFRSPRTDLTTAGQRTLLLPRMLGPILVALALLSLRGRVKR